MNDYDNLIITRQPSTAPTGMKHYNKETIIENSIFDFEYMLYKLKCLLRGTHYEKKTLLAGTKIKEDA